MNIVTIALQK